MKPKDISLGALALCTVATLGLAEPLTAAGPHADGKKGKIQEVDLLRGLDHGLSDDVDVLLVAPDGRTAVVMSDVGGNTNAFSLTLSLEDAATAALPDLAPLTSGSFQPTNHDAIESFPGAPAPSGNTALSTFNGGNPNGSLQLFVVDDSAGQVGMFSGGWNLAITSKPKKDKKHKKL